MSELYAVSEPNELKAECDLDLKHEEIKNNFTLLKNTLDHIKRQNEICNANAHSLRQIGLLF